MCLSSIMLEIDNEISRILQDMQDIPEERLLTIFNHYYETKRTTLVVQQSLYDNSKNMLNKGWDARIERENQTSS